MGIYDREEITHIFDETVNYYIPKTNWFGFKLGEVVQPSKYYKDSFTDLEKGWVKEFLSGLKKKCKRCYDFDVPLYIISEKSYWKYIKEFSKKNEDDSNNE